MVVTLHGKVSIRDGVAPFNADDLGFTSGPWKPSNSREKGHMYDVFLLYRNEQTLQRNHMRR